MLRVLVVLLVRVLVVLLVRVWRSSVESFTGSKRPVSPLAPPRGSSASKPGYFNCPGCSMTGLARPSKKAVPPVPSRRLVAPSSSKGLRGLRVEVELALVLRVMLESFVRFLRVWNEIFISGHKDPAEKQHEDMYWRLSEFPSSVLRVRVL